MESLGERIKKVMEVRGKNQTEFAATLGISSAAISQMISGKSGASNGTLFRISDVFNINLEWLKTGEGNMEKALKSFQNLSPLEQERILGLMQGMAIMRWLQEKNGPAS